MLHKTGSVEVICGSMFCGKTDELIRRLRRATIAKQKVQVFKPVIDLRYGVEKVTSHAGSDFDATPVQNASQIMSLIEPETTVVGVDEAQFFDSEIEKVVEELAEKGIRVIVAGLDLDFKGEPFGSIPYIMARAEQVLKLQAICMVCGEPASRSQRLVNGSPARYDDPIIIVGASEIYEARCRRHHEVPRDQARRGKQMRDYREYIGEVLISEEQLQARIAELGAEISHDYEIKDNLLLVCILRGGVLFLTDLMRKITVPHGIEFMAVSSYGVGNRESSGHVRITLDLNNDIKDRNVILVEDIIDSGHTIAAVLDLLSTRKPASLCVCTLLDKAERREVEVPVKYVGFSIPNKFVFGYGLDIDEYYRNLPFIGVVDLDKYQNGG